jgi:hypothetical protein
MILLNGCSFTYGDELQDPANSRWGTHLGKLINRDIHNLSAPGASNSRIFRTTLTFLAEQDLSELEGIIVMWSAFERVEMISLHNEHNYDKDSNLINGQFIQMSPSRVGKENRSIVRNYQAWETFYGEIYTRETGVVETINYMVWLKWICDQLKITCLQGWFHEGNRQMVQKLFHPSRLQTLGPKLERIAKPAKKKLNTLPNHCMVGARENNGLTFHEFTKMNGYKTLSRGHPDAEAHKAYAQFMYEYITTNNIVFSKDTYTHTPGNNLQR